MRIKILPTLALSLCLGSVGTASAENFVGHLDQASTAPPATVRTGAQGQLVMNLRNGSDLSFKLLVANIQNVVAAHIHCGAVGVPGPIGVTLFGSPAPLDVNGILAQGPTSGADEENACGWDDTGDILSAIDAGDAYVNIHTIQNLSGEIRGQIE